MKRELVIAYNDCRYVYKFKQNLIKAVQLHGYAVTVIAPHDEYAERLASIKVSFIPLEIGGRDVNPFRQVLTLWRLRRALKGLQPRAILLFGAKPNILGGFASIGLNGRVVHNITGLGTTFLRGSFQRGFMLCLYRYAMRYSDTVFFQNIEDKNLFTDSNAVSVAKALLIPGSGVDLLKFSDLPAPTATVKRVTFIGRLLFDKGIREFLNAINSLSPKYPNVTFTILGAIEEAVDVGISHRELSELVQAANIQHLGEVEDVRPYIASSICVVLPSYREGLPRVLLESLAMGVPVIATDVPGCREVAQHNVNGYLCEVKNEIALRDAMIKMLELPLEKRVLMGSLGRQYIERNFDEKIVIDHYLRAIG